MKPSIMVKNFDQEIHITLGKAIEALKKEGMELQSEALVKRFSKAISHGDSMHVIETFVNVIYEEQR